MITTRALRGKTNRKAKNAVLSRIRPNIAGKDRPPQPSSDQLPRDPPETVAFRRIADNLTACAPF